MQVGHHKDSMGQNMPFCQKQDGQHTHGACATNSREVDHGQPKAIGSHLPRTFVPDVNEGSPPEIIQQFNYHLFGQRSILFSIFKFKNHRQASKDFGRTKGQLTKSTIGSPSSPCSMHTGICLYSTRQPWVPSLRKALRWTRSSPCLFLSCSSRHMPIRFIPS